MIQNDKYADLVKTLGPFTFSIPPEKGEQKKPEEPPAETKPEIAAFNRDMIDPFKNIRVKLGLEVFQREFGKALSNQVVTVAQNVKEAAERVEERPGLKPTDLFKPFPLFAYQEAWRAIKNLAIAPLAEKTDIDEKVAGVVNKFSTFWSKKTEEVFGPSDYKNQFEVLMGAFGSGAASLASMIGIAYATRGASLKSLGPEMATKLGSDVAATYMGFLAKGSAYAEARKKGKTPEEAGELSTAVASGTALLERAGLEILFKRFGSPIMATIGKAVSEATEEGLQSLWEAGVLAKGGVRKYENLKQALQEAAIPALVGFAMGGTVGSVQGITDGMIARKTGMELSIADFFGEKLTEKLGVATQELAKDVVVDFASGGPDVIKESYKIKPSLSPLLMTPEERIFYRGTVPGETKRIDEPLDAARGRTFVARKESSARNYGESIEQIRANPDAKILREEDAAFWKLIGRRRPPNGWIGSALRKGETVIDAVNDAIRKAERAGYDIISFSSDADIGTIILNEASVRRGYVREGDRYVFKGDAAKGRVEFASGGPETMSKIQRAAQYMFPKIDQERAARDAMLYITEKGGLDNIKDEGDRQLYIHHVLGIMKNKQKFETRRDIKELSGGKKDLFPTWRSMRYAGEALEERTGVANISQDLMGVLNNSEFASYQIAKGFNKTFEDAGVDIKKLRFNPEAQNKIRQWLGEENAERRQKAWDVLDGYEKSVATVIHNELQGKTATALRYYEWLTFSWRAPELLKRYDRLLGLEKKNARAWEAIGAVKTQLDATLPKFGDPAYQELKGKLGKDELTEKDKFNFRLAKMREATEFRSKHSLDEMYDYLSKQSWGTRRWYYMSTHSYDEMAKDIIGAMQPKQIATKEHEPKARVSTELSAAKPRKGEASVLQGSLLSSVYHHVHQVKMMALMAEQIKGTVGKINADQLTMDDKKLVERLMKNAMGVGEYVPKVTRIAEVGNRWFWRQYGASLSRLAFFAGRQLPQQFIAVSQMPLYRSFEGFGDLIKSLPENIKISKAQREAGYIGGTESFMTLMGSTSFRQNVLKWWPATISMKKNVYQGFLNEERYHTARTKAGAKYDQALEFLGYALPLSDEMVRFPLFGMAYKVAENAVNKFKDGKITMNQVLKQTLSHNLPRVMTIDIMSLLGEGKYDEAVFRIAAAKTENVHGNYKVTGRSGAEQFRQSRPLAGLMTWPRIMWENAVQNGARPLIQGIEDKNWPRAYAGLRTMLGFAAGMVAAREFARRVLGDKSRSKSYTIYDSLFGYTPLSPGLDAIKDIGDDVANIIFRIQESEAIGVGEQLQFAGAQIAKTSINRLAYFAPLVSDMINTYEALNDKRGVKAAELLYNAITNRLGEEGYDVEREAVMSWYNAFPWGDVGQHIAFGTEEQPTIQGESNLPPEVEARLNAMLKRLNRK